MHLLIDDDAMKARLRVRIVYPLEKGANWSIEERYVDCSTLINLVHPEHGDLPDQCYMFMHKDDYPPVNGGREALLAAFNVPSFVASRTCFEVNGYAGCRPVFEEPQHNTNPFGEQQVEDSTTTTTTTPTLTTCTTWFRYLVKMVRKIDCFQDKHKPHDEEPEYVPEESGKGYEWFEMSLFTRWDSPGKCRVLCVDTPPDFPDRLMDALLKKGRPSLSEAAAAQADPFALHADLLDIMIVYSDISVWRVRDPIRLLEKSRLNGHDLFEQIHDHARHAYHSSEVLEAGIQTVEQLGRYQREIHESIAAQGQRSRLGLGLTYRAQAREYTQFQISLVRSLKLRSDSSLHRLKNEVGLAYNNIARQDNSVMKSIALLTMIFLPATFISALFSTTFFTYGDNGNWEVSDELWIYFVTTVPATIVIVVFWRVWLDYGDVIYKWLKGLVLRTWKGAVGSVSRTRTRSDKGGREIDPVGLRTASGVTV